MTALAVASVMVTFWATVYVPAAGVKTGNAAVMAYLATAVGLVVKPVATAIASIVSEADTVIGPVYFVEAVVGVVPLVV